MGFILRYLTFAKPLKTDILKFVHFESLHTQYEVC
jgi:hypothetical protein